MPLDKLVLIVVCVLAAMLATVWVGALLIASLQVPGLGIVVAVAAALVGYVVWRVIRDRLTSAEDDHYDRIEK